jgi:murein DD-endopeptidase MepM/ murein hydrolase activator NlpD
VAGAGIVAAASPLPLVVAEPLVARQGELLRGNLPAGSAALTIDAAPITLTADGHYMIGIDRDATGSRRLAWVTPDGRSASRTLTIREGTWDIDRLPARLVNQNPNAAPNPAWEALRKAETDAIKAARAETTPWPFWQSAFQWPATGRISGVFGSQRIYGKVAAAFHAGLDIAAPHGTIVRAPIPGIVRLASDGPFSLEGNIIILDHGQGLHSAFLHLSRILVKPGEIVAQGQEIGRIGTTGRSTGPHLHWGMTWHGVKVDPQPLLPPMPQQMPPRTDQAGR